jgi:hypothetical protein
LGLNQDAPEIAKENGRRTGRASLLAWRSLYLPATCRLPQNGLHGNEMALSFAAFPNPQAEKLWFGQKDGAGPLA